jgi:general secretion pathway protein H
MWQTGCSREEGSCNAGFTLFELLAVIIVLAMAMVAVSTFAGAPSTGIKLKTAAQMTASRLRDLRAAALSSGNERQAAIDVNARTIRFSDGRQRLQLDRSITLAVTGAGSEQGVGGSAGVRFFPNGSSTGATITLSAKRQAYEVRINWLTGRVSTAAVQ